MVTIGIQPYISMSKLKKTKTKLLCCTGANFIKSLRRVFVLKTSYEVRTLKIGFHQTIELCELLTFCRIFKTNI